MTSRDLYAIPDSLPPGMGVCVVQYVDPSNKQVSGFGRPMLGGNFFLPEIVESDSIYGGGYLENHFEAWLYGYPGNHNVVFAFPLRYSNSLEIPQVNTDYRMMLSAKYDTLDVFISEACTTFVNAGVSWYSKALIMRETLFGHTCGKLHVASSSAADANSIRLSCRAWRFLNRPRRSSTNRISMPNGVSRLEIIRENLGSIVSDSIYIAKNSLTEFHFHEPAQLPSPESLDMNALMGFPDEWVNPAWTVEHVSDIYPDDNVTKNSELISFLVGVENPIECDSQCLWKLLLFYSKFIVIHRSIGDPIEINFRDHVITNIHTVSHDGNTILLNAINIETLDSELSLVQVEEESKTFFAYSDFGLRGSRNYAVNLRGGPITSRYSRDGFSFLDDGSLVLAQSDRFALYSSNLAECVWEAHPFDRYTYSNGIYHMYSDSSDIESEAITKTGARICNPHIELNLWQEIRGIYDARFTPIEYSEDHELLVYQPNGIDSIFMATRCNSGDVSIKITPICSVASRPGLTLYSNNQILVYDGETYKVYAIGHNDPFLTTYVLPSAGVGWQYDRFIHIGNSVVVLRAVKAGMMRSIAFSEDGAEPVWLSPVRVSASLPGYYHSRYDQQDQFTSEFGKCGLFAWYDGGIHIVDIQSRE